MISMCNIYSVYKYKLYIDYLVNGAKRQATASPFERIDEDNAEDRMELLQQDASFYEPLPSALRNIDIKEVTFKLMCIDLMSSCKQTQDVDLKDFINFSTQFSFYFRESGYLIQFTYINDIE